MAAAPLDAVTIACMVMSAFGVFSLFVSSKPVTLGSVVMTIALSMSVTQAAMGMSRYLSTAEDTIPSSFPETAQPPPVNPDVVEHARMVWALMLGTLSSHTRDEL
jgi:hypothetical protein|tara:strand:+ start:4746 stop:5060 length:315 start_codon:yes stop_codon:yes gene_type:complete